MQMCIEDFCVTDHAVRDVTGLDVRASSIWKNQSLHWFGSFGVENSAFWTRFVSTPTVHHLRFFQSHSGVNCHQNAFISSRVVANRANEKDWNKSSLGHHGKVANKGTYSWDSEHDTAPCHSATLVKGLSLLFPQYLEGFTFLPPWQLFCLTTFSNTWETIFSSIAPDLHPESWTTPSVVKDISDLWHCGSKTAWWRSDNKRAWL